jgi:hypothetical protein
MRDQESERMRERESERMRERESERARERERERARERSIWNYSINGWSRGRPRTGSLETAEFSEAPSATDIAHTGVVSDRPSQGFNDWKGLYR